MLTCFFSFLGQQGLTVRNRNLVVVRMDFGEGEETVPVAAIFDEGGLQRGFYPGDACEIDVSAQLLARFGLKVEFLDSVAPQDHDSGFLPVGGIDEHLVCHGNWSPRQDPVAVPASRLAAAGPEHQVFRYN